MEDHHGIKIILRDGEIDVNNVRDLSDLKEYFYLIDDIIADSTEGGFSNKLYLNLSSRQWELISAFTKFLKTPTNKQAWFLLLYSAEYLQLVPRYSNILARMAKKDNEIRSKSQHLLDLGFEILTSFYTGQCQYIRTRGSKKGFMCGEAIPPNKRYCIKCFRKKIPRPRRDHPQENKIGTFRTFGEIYRFKDDLYITNEGFVLYYSHQTGIGSVFGSCDNLVTKEIELLDKDHGEVIEIIYLPVGN